MKSLYKIDTFFLFLYTYNNKMSPPSPLIVCYRWSSRTCICTIQYRVQTRFIHVVVCSENWFCLFSTFVLHFYNMAHFEKACSLHFQNHLQILGNLIFVYWNQLHKIYMTWNAFTFEKYRITSKWIPYFAFQIP